MPTPKGITRYLRIRFAACLPGAEAISLSESLTKENYPEQLRLIRFYDEERKKTLTFLTNNFKFAATKIAKIYKSRWKIELSRVIREMLFERKSFIDILTLKPECLAGCSK